VGSIRVPLVWEAVQPSPGGPYYWIASDEQIEAAARAGLEVLPYLYSAPGWAVPEAEVPGSGGTVSAPEHLPASGGAAGAWIAFVKAAVARYGPGGSFWAEHPGIDPMPIRTWQVWNEENFKYFVARPSPADYGKLVKLSYAAIKGLDPGAKIVLGGMFATPIEATFEKKPVQAYFAGDFLDQMYKATPGIKSKFDGVALHPYTGRYQDLTVKIEEVRTALRLNHDAGKSIWITELGWSSGPPSSDGSNSFAKGPQGQATQLRGAFRLLERNRLKWKIPRVYWFSVDDAAGACNFCDGSGLFGTGFKPKKSWFEYVKFAGGTP
jgi:hypothetical protein